MAEAETRLRAVEARIARAAEQAGRNAAGVTLVAVSKTFDAAQVEPVLAAGHRDFGENRVQEAQGKWPRLKLAVPDLRLHLIGPLQTNKVRDAVALFDAVHSVDRDRLAGRVSHMAQKGHLDRAALVELVGRLGAAQTSEQERVR